MIHGTYITKSQIYVITETHTKLWKELEDYKMLMQQEYEPFTDCLSGMNNSQIDNAKGLDVVMLICNWIKYSDN